MRLKQYFDRIYQLQMNTQNIRHFEAKVQRNAYCKIVTLLMNLFVYYVSVCDFMIDGACILTWTYHIDADCVLLPPSRQKHQNGYNIIILLAICQV